MQKSRLEKHKDIVRRFVEEVWNKGQLDVADEVLADNYIEHPSAHLDNGPDGNGNGNGNGDQARGPEPMKNFIRMFLNAFPDMQFTIERIIAEGDEVAVHLTGNGTHMGELNGLPATGKRVMVAGAAVHRIEGDKIVETYQVVDRLALRQQLGAPNMGDIDAQ